MVVYAWNLSSQKSELGTGTSLRPATESVPGQLGLYIEILYQVEGKKTKDFWVSVS